MDALFRDLHDSPSGDKSDPAATAEKPSVRVSLDLTGYEDYLKQAAKLKQDIWPDWGKMMSQHEPQGQNSEAKASQPASQASQPAAKASQPAAKASQPAAAIPNDPTQQSPSYLSWDAQKAAPSLYRAFLQEFQSPTQGSVGNLVKRLVERAHKHEHQRFGQELGEKQKVLQEQALQLHAMTADRDKWMMDHQQLVASAKQQSKMTEAQLRAAASVTAKRADDEALHARQLQHQLSSQAGGDTADRQTSGKSNSWDHITSPQASMVAGNWGAQSLPGPDGEDIFCKLQAAQEDSARLLHHMTCQLQTASQHPEVNHLIGRELDVAVKVSQIISDQLHIIPGDLRGFINMHLSLLNAYRGAESQMSEIKQQRNAAVSDLEQFREKSKTEPSEAMADEHLHDIIKPNWRSGDELRLLREDCEELYEPNLKAEAKPWRHMGMYHDSRRYQDSRQNEPEKAKDSGQNESGKDKDGRQDLLPGQQQVERLCADLKRVQAAYEDWAEGPRRQLATDDAISKEWIVSLHSDATSGDESGSEVHEASAEPDAVSRLIHSAVYDDLNAGMPVPDSNLNRVAAAEEELNKLVKAMSISGRKWANSKDALKQAANQQAKGEDLHCALDNLVDHVNKMRAHLEQFGDAVYDAEDEEEKAACKAKEAVAAMAECVAGMHRFKAAGKPTST
ncbi:hypothetical protein WJX77_005127 [Trebouxia sp. C0004]